MKMLRAVVLPLAMCSLAASPMDYDLRFDNGEEFGTFVVRAEAQLPPGAAEPRFDPAKIRLEALDSRGRLVLGPEHFRVLDSPIANPDDDVASIAFALDRVPPPGMYTVNVRVADDALPGWRPEPSYFSTALYEAPLPVAPPALKPGQRFIGINNDSSASGTALAARLSRFGVRPVVLERVDLSVSPHRLVFRIPGADEFSMRTDADAAHLPGLGALVSDPEVSSLDRRYAGRPVFPRGTSPFLDCATPSLLAESTFAGDSKLIVVHVYRLFGVLTHFGQPGLFEAATDLESHFNTERPLIVDFRRPSDTPYLSTVAVAPGGASVSPGSASLSAALDAQCSEFETRFAGAWDFERAFDLRTIAQAHPDWPRAIRAQIRAGNVRNGMTHEMVAAIVGYPNLYGTRADLDRLSDWAWCTSAKGSFSVHFKGDRVIGFDPPGSGRC